MYYVIKLFIKNCPSVEIDGEIDGGFYIAHNHSVIHPERAGKNLRVGPGVVIGQKNGKYPRIGKNVFIAANSTVIGNVVIGDNVTIGAGSVVVKDIPSNVVVVGNPAHIIDMLKPPAMPGRTE